MSGIEALVEELLRAGVSPCVAASVVARAVLIGRDAAPTKIEPDPRSKAAIRQKLYRERNASITKRNETITGVTHNETVTEHNEIITNHNENVTPLRGANSDISYLPSSSLDIQEKKESKKERKPRKRNAPLPDDWHPSLRSLQLAEEHGVSAQVVEQIFRDYLKSSGKLYADYDAAFNNFIRNQQRFNGNSGHGKTQSRSGGSLMDAIDRQLAEASLAEKSDPALPADSILRIPDRSVRRS